MRRPYRIGVVGFGVAGATASYLLARAGHQVDLFERTPVVGPVGAGVLLQPSGQIILKHLGLFDKVVSRSEPIDELHAFTHRGKTLIRLPYSEVHPDCRAYGLHRGDLFEVLHEAVVAQAVRIHLAHEITHCRIDGDSIHLTDTQARVHGPFDFVIAADGSRSLLRGDSTLTKWVHDYAYAALWAIGENDAVRRKLHQVVRGTRVLLGLLPLGQGRCNLFWSLRRRDKDALFNAGFGAWRQQVLQVCPEAGQIFDTVTGFDKVTYTTYQHVWMRRWHDDRIVFIGDAAHAMSPHLGQGINLALIDAFTLCRLLAQVDDHRQAFRMYAQARKHHLRFYAWVTLLLTPFFQSNGMIKGLGRDIFLPLMPRVPWLRRQMALTMAGLKSGFFGGAIGL